jgi:hypothetical protein
MALLSARQKDQLLRGNSDDKPQKQANFGLENAQFCKKWPINLQFQLTWFPNNHHYHYDITLILLFWGDSACL